MINIGIDGNLSLVYEGDGTRGRGVWPTPVITPAKFVFLSDSELQAESSSNDLGYRFREDSFDPISRIRRGRFYCAEDSQPKYWLVSRHPRNPFDFITSDRHGFNKGLETFYGSPIWHKYISGRRKKPVVLLGMDNRFTVWTIINVEAISTGEDLVTLKARSSLGILPQIREGEIPAEFQSGINSALDTLADEAHRASPVSIIDRARDVATQALLAYFNRKKAEAVDLGKLIKELENEKKVVAVNAANIIARLHARAKPSEQEKRELRSVREQDADLSVQCVGTLLCEIGFAEWV